MSRHNIHNLLHQMLNYFFSLSSRLTKNTFCLKNTCFGLSPNLTGTNPVTVVTEV